MTKFNARGFSIASAAALVLSLSVPALAQPGMTTSKITIETHDINLSSPQGVEKLRHRVDVAVRSACGPTELAPPAYVGLREQAQAENDCLSGAKAAADAQVKMLIARGNTRVAVN